MQSRVIQKFVLIAALATFVACEGKGVNELASSITYNVPYVGAASFSGSTVLTDPVSVPLTATLTMSQIASTVTGKIAVVQPLLAGSDTVLASGFSGRTTPTGLELNIVQTSGCALHLDGPLTLQSDSSLVGTLVGSDCNATGQNNLLLTLTLARQ